MPTTIGRPLGVSITRKFQSMLAGSVPERVNWMPAGTSTAGCEVGPELGSEAGDGCAGEGVGEGDAEGWAFATESSETLHAATRVTMRAAFLASTIERLPPS